jgi:hypothetical protein
MYGFLQYFLCWNHFTVIFYLGPRGSVVVSYKLESRGFDTR